MAVWLSVLGMVFGYICGIRSLRLKLVEHYADLNLLTLLVETLRGTKALPDTIHASIHRLTEVHRAGAVSREMYTPMLKKLRSYL